MRKLAFVLSGLLLAFSLQAGTVPRPAPDLPIQRTQQPPMHLSDFKGKYVALAFIHTTCSHCQDLTRVLTKLQTEYASKNVTFVTVAFEEGVAQNHPMYVQVLKVNFPSGYTTEGNVKKFVQWDDKRDGILYVPYMIFIDPKGVIRGDFNGKDGFFGEMEKNIRAQVEKLTKSAAPAPAKKK